MKFDTSLHQLNNSATNLVSARDIHNELESGQDFSSWIKARIEQGGFTENTDYIVYPKLRENPTTTINIESQPNLGGRPEINYFITPDMAKHLGMMERTANGVRVRQYFIDVENAANQPTFQPPLIGLKSDEAQAAMIVAESVSRMLKLPESGKLQMLDRGLEPLNLAHMLPNYGIDNSATYTTGSSQPTHAATYLLKEHGIKLSAVAFNKLCIVAGILETKERPSTKTPGKMKPYKHITEMGLKYGKNLTTQKNQRETSPHWFDHLFGELIDLIMD